MLLQVGFEPENSHLLHTMLTEMSRVQIPIRPRVFFMSQILQIFSTVYRLDLEI